MNAQDTPGPQVQLSSEIFRLLVGSVRDYAIFLLDPTGHVLTWNEGAQHIKGYQANEIIGKHFSIFYPAPEIRRGKPEYELRVAIDEGRWEEEGWRLRKDGTRFWANVVITALFDNDQLVGFAKVTRDLTERRQAEQDRLSVLTLERVARAEAEAAVERMQTLQSLTDAALSHLNTSDLLNELLLRITDLLTVDTSAVLLVDPVQPEMLVTRAAIGLDGEGVQGVRVPFGQGFAGRIANEQQPVILDDLTQVHIPASLGLHTFGIRSVMGVPLMIEDRVIGVLHIGTRLYRRFTDADVQFLQIVADRVALAVDHARLFEAERQAREEAEVTAARLRAQDEFLTIAAHELKTPMTSLLTASQLVLRRLKLGTQPDPGHLMQALTTIEGQVFRLSRLVNQLLDATRLQSSTLGLDRNPADFTALIAQAIAQVEAHRSQRTIHFASKSAVWMNLDAPRMEQVMINLLDNAIKFSPLGGQIDVTLAPTSEGVIRLVVRDRGIGIPLHHRPRIFERFYQAHAESHRSGMGLGLYITKEIIERHGGAIAVEFPEDGGTQFVVTLPFEPVQRQLEAI